MLQDTWYRTNSEDTVGRKLGMHHMVDTKKPNHIMHILTIKHRHQGHHMISLTQRHIRHSEAPRPQVAHLHPHTCLQATTYTCPNHLCHIGTVG